MKKLALIFILLTSIGFSQFVFKDSLGNWVTLTNFFSGVKYQPMPVQIISNIAIISGIDTINIAAETLDTTSQNIKYVDIVNISSGKTVYVGTTSSVSSTNGIPLNYLDSYRIQIDNPIKIYLASSSINTIVSYIMFK